MATPESILRISVTPAVLADAAAIAAIGRGTFQATFGHSMSPADMQAYLDSSYRAEIIGGDMSNPSNTFIVAREHMEPQSSDVSESMSGSKVIGFVQLKRGTTEPFLPTDVKLLELYRIYMASDSHSRGTGKLLADAAHAVARREGCRGVWLGVWEENLRAQQFYRRLGYEKVGCHDFVVGNQVDRDDVLLKMF